MGRKHRGSKDGNHDRAVAVFETLGCSVAELHDTGLADWPDLVVGCIGVNHLVEVKNPDTAYGRAGLNPGQAVFARDWRGGRVFVVYDERGIQDLVQAWRRPRSQRRDV